MIKVLLGGAGARLRFYLRILAFCQNHEWKAASILVKKKIERSLGVFVPTHNRIPESTNFPHPTGIVIGEGVEIGENVTIYQNVTIGGARQGDWSRSDYPSIGKDAVIFAGAVVVGRISLGEACVVAANSVVTRDVPPYCTVAGAPARIVRNAAAPLKETD